jgi:hypothetical protein
VKKRGPTNPALLYKNKGIVPYLLGEVSRGYDMSYL